MSGACRLTVLLLLCAATSFGQLPPRQTHSQISAPGAVRPQQSQATTPVVPQATIPANSPKVYFGNDQLSIHAENSSLADVLNAVHRATGASLDMPPSAGNERVAVSLGPGPANQVVAALLNGSSFDYVLLGRSEDPNDLAAMIVRQKGTEAGGRAPSTGMAQSYVPPQPAPEVEQDQEEPPPPEIPQPAPPEPPEEGQPVQEQAQPDQQQQQQQEQQQQQLQQQQQQNPGEAQPKTPEQLLEELKRLQMQQQQPQPGQPPQQPQPQPQEMDAPQQPI